MRGNASVGQASRPVRLLRHFSCGADYRFSWSAMHSTDRDARFGLTGRPQKMMVCPTLVRRPPLCEHKLEFALARTGRQAGPTFLLLAMLATLAAPQLPARNVALVIGNQSYGPGALKTPASDARLVEAALREAGFVTVLRENAGRVQMVEAASHFVGSNLEIPPSSISPVTLWPSRTKTSWWEWIAVRATFRRGRFRCRGLWSGWAAGLRVPSRFWTQAVSTSWLCSAGSNRAWPCRKPGAGNMARLSRRSRPGGAGQSSTEQY